MFTITALVLSLSPVHLPVDVSLGQAKIQIIKGKRGTVKAANAGGEAQPQSVQQGESTAARNRQLDQKEAQLDAKQNELNEREQALEEKQTAAAEKDKRNAEQQKKLQKQVEKIGEVNERMWQGAADGLAGE